MSLTRAQIQAKRRADAEARRNARAQAEQAADAGGQGEPEEESAASGPLVPASREAEPTAETAVNPVAEGYRPQPFTPDLIPEPEDLDLEGPMSEEELVELSYCEAAYTNADKAEWIKWMAAESVRRRKKYRGEDGSRTWPEYCEAAFGESESEVNRSIQQWRLKRAIATQQTARPLSTPSSHVQALLPIVEAYGGEEEVARNYLGMRIWSAENKMRVTAADLESWVQRAQAVEKPAERPALTGESLLEVREERVRHKQATPRSSAKQPAAEEPAASETHPNSGDQAPPPDADADAAGDEEYQEPEAEAAGAGGDEPKDNADNPHTARLAVAASELDGMSQGVVEADLLQFASTETLKTIVQATRTLAEAAEAELAKR
ncbi:hypothetical protein ACIRO1_45335 [Streptomyces sp. NPDC102381]|uniref:hypothetical protein n=1 Tax=Streptomyces sp. NPDC102381 TaxID=3366164 RepID=UPI0037F32572